MPILEYQCASGDCQHVCERIYLGPVEGQPRSVVCPRCLGESPKKMSMPARICMADMEKVNRRRQRIKEPMWRDLATNKLTPVNP
jgi:hypothetical protein